MGEHTLEKLHWAAEFKSSQEVAALIAEVDDVDGLDEGRTALWRAVHAGRSGNVQVLLAAGADPARPMVYGWSPARLSLATEHPLPTDEVLTPEERAAIAERDRLVAALGGLPRDDGHSLACVADVDAKAAVRRLEAEPVEVTEQVWTYDADLAVVGVTTVPGGCVVFQPKGYAATRVLERLSVGTVGFGMYANPKGGDHGAIWRDGECEIGDRNTGGGADLEDTAADVLLAHLYQGEPVAYCLAFAGLRPTDARAFTAPDVWVRLPGHLTS